MLIFVFVNTFTYYLDFAKAHICFTIIIMKKISVGFLTAVFLFVAKIFKYVFKFLYFVLGKIVIYLGLHFPILYLFFTSFFIIFKQIDFQTKNLNSLLFFIGLMISFFCMFLVLIKNLIVNPKGLQEYFKARKEKQKKKLISEDLKTPTPEDIEPTPPPIQYPLIYPSQNNSNVVIFEYENKYDIYLKNENGITQIDTKVKNIKN